MGRWIWRWFRRWGRKSGENAPAFIFLYLALAALLGLVLWKMPAKTAQQEWIFILPMAVLLLFAAQELVLSVAYKRRQQRAETAETEPENLPEGAETEEMREKRRTGIAGAVFAGLWIIKGLLDLRRGWVNTLVYDGLFFLVGALVAVWAFKQYRAARDAWKGE